MVEGKWGCIAVALIFLGCSSCSSIMFLAERDIRIAEIESKCLDVEVDNEKYRTDME